MTINVGKDKAESRGSGVGGKLNRKRGVEGGW
jgi:hypothetical protein